MKGEWLKGIMVFSDVYVVEAWLIFANLMVLMSTQ
jgi:hypothetical protein